MRADEKFDAVLREDEAYAKFRNIDDWLAVIKLLGKMDTRIFDTLENGGTPDAHYVYVIEFNPPNHHIR